MKFSTRHKIVSTLLKDGKGRTGEKLIFKSFKSTQKNTKKRFAKVLKLFIRNSLPIFSINQQKIKKGKRKMLRVSPSFIPKNNSRIMLSIKFLKKTSFALKRNRSNGFFTHFANEILSALQHSENGNKKINEIHKQAIMYKRYLTRFQF